jgi:hypothetical protein
MHEHLGMRAQWWIYSKMKPDSFTLQLQTILTALFQDIKGVVSASGCTKLTPPASPEGGAAAAPGGDGPASAPSPGGRSGGGRGRAVVGGKQAAGKAQG